MKKRKWVKKFDIQKIGVAVKLDAGEEYIFEMTGKSFIREDSGIGRDYVDALDITLAKDRVSKVIACNSFLKDKDSEINFATKYVKTFKIQFTKPYLRYFLSVEQKSFFNGYSKCFFIIKEDRYLELKEKIEKENLNEWK